MRLLILSIIFSFGNMLSFKFLLKLVSWFLDNNIEDRKIRDKIVHLKNEQSKISIVKEFAKHAKLQRQINKSNDQLKNKIRENASKNFKLKFICKLSLYIFSAIVNFIFVYYNYHQTVLNNLPSNWFSPLSWLVSWPSSQVDTMGFIFWYSITNYVAKVTTNNLL
ncbi:tail-anchored protein insertion receptor WRB-like [Sipha flava]|uniref:Guided entry of tail-anchored proteins factor 1 n=1 Tax=Sipha flava TaxID=143950 RepID=A0A2S2R9U0_9HEMI|nr:tail-anchored protein insertion receptor WRB-like [Sipha flava]